MYQNDSDDDGGDDDNDENNNDNNNHNDNTKYDCVNLDDDDRSDNGDG